MDFFSSQDHRHKQSAILVMAFVVLMIAMAIVVHVVSVVFTMHFNPESNFLTPTVQGMFVIGLAWFVCLIGCYSCFLEVREGGAALAKHYGAIEASRASYNRQEQTLFDIVEEMAIASSCAAPALFIHQREKSINAFVVGSFVGKEALVVSRGALDTLDREELSAVVAHEFAHIAHGDISLNMRLLVALSGFYAIDDVGKLIIGDHAENSSHFHPLAIVGYIVRGVGSIGTYSGRLLTSAVSRQREYLADATAVQYTRAPIDLASALDKIQKSYCLKGFYGAPAEKIAHLCFQEIDSTSRRSRLFATHPSIQKRINAIDPHMSTKLNMRERRVIERKASSKSAGNGATTGNGVPTIQQMGMDISPSGLSDIAALTLVDTVSCMALLHAVFISPDSSKHKLYTDAIVSSYDQSFAEKVEKVSTTLSDKIVKNKMMLIDTAVAQIKTTPPEQQQKMLQSLEQLLCVEGAVNLMNYATLQLIRQKLGVASAKNMGANTMVGKKGSSSTSEAIANDTEIKSFDAMGREFAVLLSLIVESSDNKNTTNEEQFQLALACYTKEAHTMLSANDAGIVEELERAFQTLNAQPKAIREGFVKHCHEIIQADHYITSKEQVMLDLFAASLNCEAARVA